MSACKTPDSKTTHPADFNRTHRMPDTSFYQLGYKYFDEFKRVYPHKYREDFGYWRPVIDDVVRKFLRCGVLDYGFARVRCWDGEQGMFVSFSCRRRGFCPSCHQNARSTWLII